MVPDVRTRTSFPAFTALDGLPQTLIARIFPINRDAILRNELELWAAACGMVDDLVGACRQKATTPASTAAHASSGASSSGGPHPAEDVLPALDAGILQTIRKLGRYPKEFNRTSMVGEDESIPDDLRMDLGEDDTTARCPWGGPTEGDDKDYGLSEARRVA